MVDTAIEMEGTCTGGCFHQYRANSEHGVGMVKKEYLVQELGLETVELMRRIKVHTYPSHAYSSSLSIHWNS
jgi:D-lactate dehydrogenase (cytochrome)